MFVPGLRNLSKSSAATLEGECPGPTPQVSADRARLHRDRVEKLFGIIPGASIRIVTGCVGTSWPIVHEHYPLHILSLAYLDSYSGLCYNTNYIPPLGIL
jgi:hypothetical protein